MSQPFKADSEDFNVFVSPRLFSGRTPSAATTKTRVFQDATRMQLELQAVASEEQPAGNNDAKRPAGIEIQSILRRRIAIANWIAVAVGFFVIMSGSWVAAEHFERAISPVIYHAARVLGEPLYLGGALVIAGIAMICYGIVGSGSLSSALASGSLNRTQRITLVLYEVLMLLALTACVLALFASGSALEAYKGRSVVPTHTWRAIPPHTRCTYELLQGCVGHIRGQCTSIKDPVTQCAGLHCQKVCQAQGKSSECQKCAVLVKHKLIFSQCVKHELNSNVDVGCGESLLRRARILLVASALAGMLGSVCTVGVAVFDLLVTN